MKKLILAAVLFGSLIAQSQNMKDFVQVGAFDIKVLKTSPEAITYINGIANKEKLTVAIGPDCSQKDFEVICKLNWIADLKIGSSYPNKTLVSDLKPLELLKNLKKLAIFSQINAASNKPLDVTSISKLPQLEWLTIASNTVTNVKKLSTLVNLNYLDFSDAGVNDLSFMTTFAKLNNLSLTGENLNFINVAFLSNLKSLEKLTIENNKAITEEHLKSLAGITSLKMVDLDGCKNIKSLDFIAASIRMEEVSAEDCGLVNINGLSNMANLTELNINNTKVTSLSPLNEKRKLTKLRMEGLKVTDISALYNCVSLEKIYVGPGITEQQQKDLQDKLPNAEIKVKED